MAEWSLRSTWAEANAFFFLSVLQMLSVLCPLPQPSLLSESCFIQGIGQIALGALCPPPSPPSYPPPTPTLTLPFPG